MADDVRVVGRLIGLFSFDVGYEIDLDRAARLLGPTASRDRLGRRRAAPAYVDYTSPPVRAPLGPTTIPLAGGTTTAAAGVVVHELGAVTIVLTAPLACDVAALPPLTATLAGAGPLEDVARGLLADLRPRLATAVTKPADSDMVEDYYVIQIDRLEPALATPEFVARCRAPLASALRCEASPLSPAEIDDALRTQLSYYPDDVVVTDWNVAIVVDTDYAGAVDVLEFLNVQLLELRWVDAVLDRHVADTWTRTALRARRIPLLNDPYQKAVDDLAAIRLDVAAMFERIHNAVKLGGDVYLAKLHARTAERLGLATWEASVRGKLDVLHQLYNLMVERVATARSEVLELTIVVLIVVELAVLLAGWG